MTSQFVVYAYLVDGRHDARAVEDLLQVLDAEVGHANALGEPLLLQLLDLLPHGLEVALVLLGGVDEEEVDVLELELLERSHERVADVLAGRNGGQLGGHVERLARLARRCDGGAERVLVAVHLGAVEVHDAVGDGTEDILLGVLGIQRGAGAESEPGDLAAVVEGD